MKEVWKEIEGYDGKYQASNLGRIRKIEILKQHDHNLGYKYVNITKDKQTKHIYVHRLIAQTFIPNLNNLEMVNHKDEDKTNNIPENLEWVTCKENNNYGTAPTRRAKTRSKPVLQYSLDGKFIKEWESAREVERVLGFSNVCINQCCNKKIKKSKGYMWKFK